MGREREGGGLEGARTGAVGAGRMSGCWGSQKTEGK